MAVHVGNTPIRDAYLGATPLKAIYVGATEVWSNKPVEVLPANTSPLGTRNDFLALLAKYGLNDKTVKELPFILDTSKVTNMQSMFYGFSSLVSVPDLDTSRVQTTLSMFRFCSALTDGNVRLIRPDGTKPPNRADMIFASGLKREPFFLPDGTPIN